MTASKMAKVFGWVFLLIGILGFIPGITTGGHLLGIFEVDVMHNIVHLLTGIIALSMAKGSAKTFFKVFGVIYAVVAILGLIGASPVLGLIHVNGADNVLHILIALIALYYGFAS